MDKDLPRSFRNIAGRLLAHRVQASVVVSFQSRGKWQKADMKTIGMKECSLSQAQHREGTNPESDRQRRRYRVSEHPQSLL